MTCHRIILLALCRSIFGRAHAATEELVDLTKTTPAKTDNSFNLGPTGALGWMYVCLKSHVGKSGQILITLVEKSSPAEGKLEVGDVILGVFGKLFADDARRVFGQAETEKADVKLPMIVWRKGESQTL